MHEQSPEDYIDTLERRFDRKKKLRAFLLDIAMSSVVIMAPSSAHIVFEEIHKNDALPHD